MEINQFFVFVYIIVMHYLFSIILYSFIVHNLCIFALLMSLCPLPVGSSQYKNGRCRQKSAAASNEDSVRG